ncbi:hypothetical protein [Bradyrhizobium sp. USDA 223]|uniref:hypothetical protein n=1 Tax=Bradyrhizobium sp. USDA 223 TaxID=3156306 RepID=UPI0038381834
MRQLIVRLVAGAILCGFATIGMAAAEEPAKGTTAPRVAPSPAKASPTPVIAPAPSATLQPQPAPIPPSPSPTANISPGPAPIASPRPPAGPAPSQAGEANKTPVVQCNCSSEKDDGSWRPRDWAPLLTGIAGIFGALVAAIAIIFNLIASRGTTIQKANEAELEALQSKLDNFYGPYVQLSKTNELIASDLKNRHAAGKDMRILVCLLDPKWRDQFSSGEAALVEEILAIDKKLLDLIQDKSGLVSNAVQPYLWRAASHFRIMMLASESKLDNDPGRYEHYVYPRQLDEIVDLETKRIHGRIELIRKKPMELHPPAPELAIPEGLKLPVWLASADRGGV